MSFDTLSDLNWPAVLVATLAYFAWGAIWYAPPVLGKAWMAASGMDSDEMGDGPPPAVFIVPFVFSLIASIALGMFAEATASDTFSEGLVLGLVVGIGFGVSIIGVTAMFESKKPNPTVWGVITAGYHLVGLLSSALIVSVWD